MAFNDDKKKTTFPTRFGVAQGTSFENRMLSNVGGPGGTRTKVTDNPDGSKTILKTRMGNPVFTTEGKRATAAGCPKPPLVEINFAYAATQIGGNPYSGPTGYRLWYGDDSLPPKPQYNWSHDGVFSLLARLQKRISFLDASEKTVDFIFAKKPHSPDDLDEVENQPYDDVNTFTKVVADRAAGSSALYRFVEGRHKYREWYDPELIDLGWLFSIPAPAFSFLAKRLKKIVLRAFEFRAGATSIINTVTWKFVKKDSTVLPGHNEFALCSSQSAREISYPARDFFTENGHMRSVTLRVGYLEATDADPPPTGAEIQLKFKTPGSFLAVLNPESIIPSDEHPASTPHPGVDKAMDLLDFAAFGNSYHGVIYRAGTDPAKIYKDTTLTDEWTDLNAFTKNQGYPQRYYNFQNVDSLDPENIVDDLVLVDGVPTPSGRKFYKDIIINGTYPFPIVPTISSDGALAWNQHLYKDPTGNVWVIQVEQWLFMVSGTFDRFVYSVWVNGQYKDLEHLRPYGNTGYNPSTSKILYSSPDINMSGTGENNFLFADCSFIVGSYTYFYPSTKNSPDGKHIAVMLHSGCMYESIVFADDIVISGTGITDPLGAEKVGDGIVATRTRISLPAQNHQSASLGGGNISHDREMVNGLFFSGGAWKYTSVKGHAIQNIFTPYGYSWDWTVSVTIDGTPVGSPCGFSSVYTGPSTVEYTMLDSTDCPGGIVIPSIFIYPYWNQGTDYMRGVLLDKPVGASITGSDAFFITNTYNPVAACNAVYVINPAERSGQVCTVVFEDGTVSSVPLDDASQWDDGAGNWISAKKGFAYDYRSKAIIFTPTADLAQFI